MPLGAVPAPRRWLAEGRASRRLALAVVFVALLLDNMLLTVVGRAAGHLGGVLHAGTAAVVLEGDSHGEGWVRGLPGHHR